MNKQTEEMHKHLLLQMLLLLLLFQKDAQEAMRGMDSCGVPFDALWLDIDHTPHCKYFLEDTRRVDLKQLASELEANQRMLVRRMHQYQQMQHQVQHLQRLLQGKKQQWGFEAKH